MIKKISTIFSKKKHNSDESIENSRIDEYNNLRKIKHPYSFCYAPFSSLYFRNNGDAIACCYNHTYITGSFPAQSINEIWNSEKIAFLRKELQKNNLTHGCYQCSAPLQSANYASVKSLSYDIFKISKSYPVLLEFELENTCNLSCIMCHEGLSSSIEKNKNVNPLHKSYNEEFVTQLTEFIPHIDEARFYGGEPFLIEIYYSIWEKIIMINPACRILVQTNGTILNERMKKILESGNFHITVSLDSIKKQTFENIRKNSNFEKVIEHTLYFQNYCIKHNTYFGFSFCPLRENWQEIPEFIIYANKINVPVYFHHVWLPPDHSLWTYDVKTLLKIYDYLTIFNAPENSSIQINNANEYKKIINQISSWIIFSEIRESNEQKIKNLTVSEISKLITENIKNYIIELALNNSNIDIQFYLNRFSNILSQVGTEYKNKAIRKLYSIPLPQITEILEYHSDLFIIEQIERLAKS